MLRTHMYNTKYVYVPNTKCLYNFFVVNMLKMLYHDIIASVTGNVFVWSLFDAWLYYCEYCFGPSEQSTIYGSCCYFFALHHTVANNAQAFANSWKPCFCSHFLSMDSFLNDNHEHFKFHQWGQWEQDKGMINE